MNKAIEFDLSPLIKQLDVMQKVQVPFAASLALNATANHVREQLNAATETYFDKPVPFTRTAFRYTRSHKTDLVATVFPEARRATYLGVQIEGGDRPSKRYESFLRKLSEGGITRTSKLLPARRIRDSFGNPRRSTFRQVEQGLASKYIFIGKPKGRPLPPGVYRRVGHGLQPLFTVLARDPQYRPQFPLYTLGERVARERFPIEFEKAMKRALSS